MNKQHIGRASRSQPGARDGHCIGSGRRGGCCRRPGQYSGTTTTTSGLEEVVVTATRREQSLQEVPLSVSALSADNLANRNINNLGDLSAGKIPGFVPTRFSGGSTLAISVRGVGLSDPTQGTVELAVPVYIDGVFLGRAQGLGMELIDPERVEILRGPQGQLFGRNAEGGVVQYVTRKPTGEFGIRAETSLRRLQRHTLEGDHRTARGVRHCHADQRYHR